MSRRLLCALLLLGCGDRAPPRSFGKSRQPIVGGVTDPAHQYVVMVGDDIDGFCSGTLISKRTVITAGHCWGAPGNDPITRIDFDTGNPITRSRLESAGCKVSEFDGTEICFPGAGGPTCLTRPLLRA